MKSKEEIIQKLSQMSEEQLQTIYSEMERTPLRESEPIDDLYKFAYTDVKDFIQAVKNKHDYSAILKVDKSDIKKMYTAHKMIDDAIDSLDGYRTDQSRWLDPEAIKVFLINDPFRKNGNYDIVDRKYYVLSYFVRPTFKKFSPGLYESEEDLALDVYQALVRLEEEFLKNRSKLTTTDDDSSFSYELSLYIAGKIRCSIIQYETTYEFSAEYYTSQSYSESYSFIENVDDSDKPIFGSSEFFTELDHELIVMRTYWLDKDDDDAMEKFSKRKDLYILNYLPEKDFYAKSRSIINFLSNFFTVNDENCAISSFSIYSEICDFISDDSWPKKEQLGSINYFTYGQYNYIAVVAVDGKNQIVVVNRDLNFTAYINSDTEAWY